MSSVLESSLINGLGGRVMTASMIINHAASYFRPHISIEDLHQDLSLCWRQLATLIRSWLNEELKSVL